ncbi:COP9 signalosome complex subunit 4-like [Atheta coriaria]|uniref:COP9 signalosome complex subunit 4-like n=1 Tax=Dalotia coriaria TaxID=877792 RepID=UPI0031F34864
MEQVFDIGPIINLNIIDEKLAILANLNYDTEYLEVGYYFLCDLMIINLPEDELVAGLIKYINALVDHNLPLDLAKEMITYFGFKLVRLEHSISKPVAKHASNRFLPLEMAFGEQLSMVRQHLASVYELKGKWEKAIQALKSIELETGIHGQYSSNYKLGTYLRLSRFYLEIHNGEEAESYINRAGYTLVDAEDESLHTDFKVGCARVLDFQQKFIDAAQHYHDLATCEYQPRVQLRSPT